MFLACSFSISLSMEPSILRVALAFSRHQNSTDSDVEQTLITVMSDNSLADAILLDSVNQPVNGSLCQIISLEVYRGRGHITEISHNGFSLSDKGTFMVINYFN